MRSQFKAKMSHSTAALLAAMALTMGGFSVYADDTGTTSGTTDESNVTINIYKTEEATGTELGTNSRARGNGSIATGKNSLAIGKNAVATGGNETKASIEEKLKENQDKLDEISELTTKTETLSEELTSIRNTYADVIEAGERVKQVKEAKSKAYDDWQTKLTTYNTETENSKAYLEECQAKIDDLNSRLTGVSQLTSVDITSDEGLTTAATQLKEIAEKDTTLNLSVDFYKDYVQSYYQALGDLRLAKLAKSSMTSKYFYSYSSDSDSLSGKGGSYALKPSDYQNIFGVTYSSITNALENSLSSYNSYDSDSDSSSYYPQYYSGTTVTDKPTGDFLKYADKNVNTEIISESEYNLAIKDKATVIAAYTKYITDSTDPFLTDAIKADLIQGFTDDTNNYWGSRLDILYYQGKYEETGDTTWLDKKKAALDTYSKYESSSNCSHSYATLQKHISELFQSWNKTNITDIENKNKVTTDTLTSELETALGISKDAVTKKQQELAALKAKADQAKTNYESINPDQADVYLSEQYETVMKQLEEKAAELKTSQERLEALKAALTLHDLTDVGENAMAIGTDALATGTNSMAIGTGAVAVGEDSIAIGDGATVTGAKSIAIGYGNAVLGDNSGAFGDPNTVYGSGSYAIGNDNTIGATDTETNTPLTDKGNNTFVFGSNVTTTANNAVILGSGSEASEDNVVSVGSSTNQRKIINVADGTADSDAATVGQVNTALQKIKQTVSTQGVEVTSHNSSINDMNTSIASMKQSVSNLSSNVANTIKSLNSSLNSSLNTSLTNLTNDGKAVIRDYINEVLRSNNISATVSLTSDVNTVALASEAQPIDDSTTVTKEDINTINAELSNKVDKADFNTLKDTVATNAESIKANTSAINSLKDSKADANASNLTEANVKAWSEKLGTGEISEGNTGLVNGGTVYEAISKVNENSLIKSDGKALTIGTNDASTSVDFKNSDGTNRILTGIKTDTDDMTSAANVGYVQETALSLYSGLNESMNQMYRNMERNMNKGLAGAAALAALHPLEYDPEDKFNFAVGYGHYKSANATALGAYYYANANTMFSLGATIGNGNTAFNASVAFKIGHGSTYNGVSKAAMASAINDQQKRLDAQDARIAQLEQALMTLQK